MLHGIIDREEVQVVFQRMAEVVDRQNDGDPLYVAMAPTFSSVAFRAALALALEGVSQPSGYTEPILHAYRIEQKLGA